MKTRRTIQRKNSNQVYLNALQEKYSKILVIRLDLSYKKPFCNDITLEEATIDLKKLLNNRRNNKTIFEHNIGYIVKKEFGFDLRIHFHVFFFFNGQEVQKGSFRADQIGKYWNEKITKDKGTYYNCNRNKYPEHGIGMLIHTDKQKRAYLDNAISYLCKEEQHIKKTRKERLIVRSTISRSKSKYGRSRHTN